MELSSTEWHDAIKLQGNLAPVRALHGRSQYTIPVADTATSVKSSLMFFAFVIVENFFEITDII